MEKLISHSENETKLIGKKFAEKLKKGDVIGQVIFQKYLTVDDDNATGMRTGGFGSTNK